MYIRESRVRNKKTGALYISHQLVETVHTEKGPRNRILFHLGRLDLDPSRRKVLADLFAARLSGLPLLPGIGDPELLAIVDTTLREKQVDRKKRGPKPDPAASRPRGTAVLAPDSIKVLDCRSAGPELVAYAAWEQLGLSEILLSAGLSHREIALACAVVIGRLVAPGSDLATHRWLTSRSSLPEMVDGRLLDVGKDPLYTITDRLWSAKETIEARLSEAVRAATPAGEMVLLYDLSNTYFEGAARGNPLARRGHSKEKRSDCPLVTFSLVVDQKGRPVVSRIDPGNQSEPETLASVLDRLESLLVAPIPGLGFPKPTLVMDRGIATRENLALMKVRGFPYCVVERRPAEKAYREEFEKAKEHFAWFASDPETPETGVWLKKVELPDDPSVVRALVLSETRKLKEEGMDTLKETRFIAALEQLRASIRKGTLTQGETVCRRLGKIEATHPSVARYYKITPVSVPGAPLKPSQRKKKEELSSGEPAFPRIADLVWEKTEKQTVRKDLTGAYVIETTHTDLSASGIWSLYITLTRVEDAFRSLKSDLGIRPVYHQGADRTRAHLFVSLLAYALLSRIETTLRASGDTRSWSTLRKTLETYTRVTVTGSDPHTGYTYKIRDFVEPEAPHRTIFQTLGIASSCRRSMLRFKPESGQM